MQVNLFFDQLSNGELLTLKTGPPCIDRNCELLCIMIREMGDRNF